jgi:hypothetical protein
VLLEVKDLLVDTEAVDHALPLRLANRLTVGMVGSLAPPTIPGNCWRV